MCGICGYVGDHRPELLEPMRDAMVHRGPDDAGAWHDAAACVGLGHRRLSIIDLSEAAHQPMCNEDGSIWIAFNGEIYDFELLRERLMARGHAFKSRSDTEVLLHLYEDEGVEFLQALNGMFALAVWDGRQRQLLLARDHAGVKPLYYWQNGERLFFASEIKALLRIPELPRRLRRECVASFLTFLWVSGEDTMLDCVRKVEPGHYLLWKDGRVELRRWFRMRYEAEEGVSEEDWVERVHDTFMRTTRRQMVSDVPLGAFLSGGADSSSIVACMRHSFPQRQINCYTAHFDAGDIGRDQFIDDYPFARHVADRLEVNLRSFVLKPDIVSLLPKMVYHLDEPDADPAILPSYLICKMAREDGTTVLLSGTGGDEVFFGYRSHQAYRQYERFDRIPRWLAIPGLSFASYAAGALFGAQGALPRRLRKFHSGAGARGLARHLSLVDWSSHGTRSRIWSRDIAAHAGAACGAMQRYFDSFEGRGEINRHSHVLIQTFLAAHNFLYTDKSSMATSVEVRVPFVDLELMRLCARIPERFKLRGRVTKYVLKRAMERYIGREVLHRSKTGFGVPLRKWIVDDLKPLIDECLSERRIRERGLFDPKSIRDIVQENATNRGDHAYLIYSLVSLELWQQTFIDRAGIEAAG